MKQIITAMLCIALASCQTIRINGVEISKDDQVKGIFAAILAGTIIYILQDDEDEQTKRTCLRQDSVGNCIEFADDPWD